MLAILVAILADLWFSWGVLGGSWQHLWPSWPLLGRSWAILGEQNAGTASYSIKHRVGDAILEEQNAGTASYAIKNRVGDRAGGPDAQVELRSDGRPTMGSAECLWLVGIDFCHLKTDNLESLEHAWHPEGGGGSKTPGGGTPPPPHHTVVTLWSVVLRFGVLLATFGELWFQNSTDMVAKSSPNRPSVGDRSEYRKT